MITAAQITSIVEECIKGTPVFIVDITVSTGNHIHIEIDTPQGVSIKECLTVSRAVEGSFDRDKEDFSLEVTSPGLDKPLRIPQQYLKNIGREVKVVAADGREIKGRLHAANDKGFVVLAEKMVKQEGKKKKELVAEQHEMLYGDIKSTQIVISFK